MTQTTPCPDFTDHADFYRRGPYASFLTDRRVVGRLPVSMFAVEQPAGHFPDPAMPTILLYLASKGVREAHFDWGSGRWKGAWRTGDLTLVPAGAASDVTLSGRHSFFGLCLPVGMFVSEGDDTGQDAARDLGRLYAAPFRDDLLKELFAALWREGRDGGADYNMFADSALQCLVNRLGYLARKPVPGHAPAGLSSFALKQVNDFIHAHLEHRIRITDLAAIAGHSPSHFSLLFKRATGRTPYAHVLALRVERARELIASSARPNLAEIALTCGFSSQSHMTAIFRQMTGTTPGRLD